MQRVDVLVPERDERRLRGAAARDHERHVPVHDRAEHGDAEDDADVARRARHRGRDTRLVARHARDRDGADRRVQHRVAGADHDVGGEQPAERRVHRQQHQQPDARRQRERPADQHAARPARADEVAAERASDDRRHGRRQRQEAGRERRVAAHVLQVERVEEDEAGSR